MISSVIVLFLLGFSPTEQPSQDTMNQWEALSTQEQAVLIENFEQEYDVKIDDVTPDAVGKMADSSQVRVARALDWRDSQDK